MLISIALVEFVKWCTASYLSGVALMRQSTRRKNMDRFETALFAALAAVSPALLIGLAFI
jgi:hypothetical protein